MSTCGVVVPASGATGLQLTGLSRACGRRSSRLAWATAGRTHAHTDFYASTGVEVSDIQATGRSLTIAVKEQSFAKYTVQFIGSGGRVLKEAAASPARYDVTGGEGYVRAKVVDSNGQAAWTQPMRVPAA